MTHPPPMWRVPPGSHHVTVPLVCRAPAGKPPHDPLPFYVASSRRKSPQHPRPHTPLWGEFLPGSRHMTPAGKSPHCPKGPSQHTHTYNAGHS